MEHEDIIEIIKNRDKILAINRERMKKTLKEIGEVDSDVDLISDISLRSRILSNDLIRTSTEVKDLHRIIELKKKKERERALDLREFFMKLCNEREQIHRLLICYHALPADMEEILCQLYEERTPWKQLEMKLGVNHRILCNKRNAALNMINQFYQSDYSNREIISLNKK